LARMDGTALAWGRRVLAYGSVTQERFPSAVGAFGWRPSVPSRPHGTR
jgi:hypothetical protein